VTQTATAGMKSRDASASVGCLLCGGAAAHLLKATDRNREITGDRFAYARCESCRTVFIADPPPDLGRYYDGDYYQFDAAGEPTWKGNPAQIRSASYRLALLERHVTPGHLIEIGAGTGAFASTAQAAGFAVSAIEMSDRCCRYLSEQEGIKAICSDRPLDALSSLPPARAVALWHVLEHLPNPAEVLARTAEKLEPGGVLAIAIPNPRSLQFRLMGSRWAHLDAPRHLCLTPAEAIVERAEAAGLRCVEMTTNDPDGLECNQLGWATALRRRPADGPSSRLVGNAALALCAVMAPLERTGRRGAAITLLLRKGP
jgi:SAM-dependent methyltransferase